MPEAPQLARPSRKPKDPTARLRRKLVIVTWVAIVVIPAAVLYTPRLVAAVIAMAMFGLGAATAYNSGMRSGVALQRQACREGRRG